eukprot:scaffold267695_cov30-Tisochrysis_lutea.AAC.2
MNEEEQVLRRTSSSGLVIVARPRRATRRARGGEGRSEWSENRLSQPMCAEDGGVSSAEEGVHERRSRWLRSTTRPLHWRPAEQVVDHPIHVRFDHHVMRRKQGKGKGGRKECKEGRGRRAAKRAGGKGGQDGQFQIRVLYPPALQAPSRSAARQPAGRYQAKTKIKITFAAISTVPATASILMATASDRGCRMGPLLAYFPLCVGDDHTPPRVGSVAGTLAPADGHGSWGAGEGHGHAHEAGTPTKLKPLLYYYHTTCTASGGPPILFSFFRAVGGGRGEVCVGRRRQEMRRASSPGGPFRLSSQAGSRDEGSSSPFDSAASHPLG